MLECKKRANKKWCEKNRAYRNYLTKRSTSRNFIRNEATLDDLNELSHLIKIKKETINNSNNINEKNTYEIRK